VLFFENEVLKVKYKDTANLTMPDSTYFVKYKRLMVLKAGPRWEDPADTETGLKLSAIQHNQNRHKKPFTHYPAPHSCARVGP